MNKRKDIKTPDDGARIKKYIEGILFISETPVKLNEMSQFLKISERKVDKIIKELEAEFLDQDRGFILRKVGGGYRFYSNPEINDVLKNFIKSNYRTYLSNAALETLAIMCYMQPVTRTQIAEIRGVRTDSVFHTLIDKGLIKEAGRLKEPGNPKTYMTTDRFLEIIGLDSLKQIPPLQDFDENNLDS
jgi:segregation and condensation protein B